MIFPRPTEQIGLADSVASDVEYPAAFVDTRGQPFSTGQRFEIAIAVLRTRGVGVGRFGLLALRDQFVEAQLRAVDLPRREEAQLAPASNVFADSTGLVDLHVVTQFQTVQRRLDADRSGTQNGDRPSSVTLHHQSGSRPLLHPG